MVHQLSTVPFNRPFATDSQLEYVRQALAEGHWSGDGRFTARCSRRLEELVGSNTALLTQSCTAALEIAAFLLDLEPGDEVIMPSYTFVSTANAFVIRGATPVFVDIRPDTLNIDESKIEAAITPRTKAIVVVHYAGVACEMDTICEIAARHGLPVIEDAAQALMSAYRGRALGGVGDLGTFSFHETKNISCGEGGSLQINNPAFRDRAHYLREKGTNRTAFLQGKIDKYTWIDQGSSYLPSEITAAVLWAQLEEAREITERRLAIHRAYDEAFKDLEARWEIRRPVTPAHCSANAHMFYLMLPDHLPRADFLKRLDDRGVAAVSHYVPLHSAPAGRKFGRVSGDMQVTDASSAQIVRLPLWPGMESEQDRVISAVYDAALDASMKRRRLAPAA